MTHNLDKNKDSLKRKIKRIWNSTYAAKEYVKSEF